MPKFMNDFVQHNKASFALQEEKLILNVKDYLELVIAFLIICLVFTGVGFITNAIKNMYYIFFAVNATCLFTFYLLRFKTYIKMTKQAEQDHTFSSVLALELIRLLAILMTFQSLLFFIYFQQMITPTFLIMMIVVAISLTTFNNYMNQQIGIKRTYIVYCSAWLLFAYLIIFYFLPMDSKLVQYVIATGIVSLMVLYQFALNKFKSNDKLFQETLRVFLIMMIVVIMLFNFLNFLYAIGFLWGESNYLEQENLQRNQHLLLSKPAMILILSLVIQIRLPIYSNIRGEMYA